MPNSTILVLNCGSSSIKLSMWEASPGTPQKLLEGEIEGIGSAQSSGAVFWIKSWLEHHNGDKVYEESVQAPDLESAFELISEALNSPPFRHPDAIGHRMVCGGPTVIENQLLTPELIREMEKYTAFAPLHAPSELFLMRHSMQMYPGTPNFVCLDSWLHRDLPDVTRELPIPAAYKAMGLRRFGAHGLSYESIVAHLQPNVPKRVIAAHLGNGASICAIRDGKSIDTSMGLTPTGGIISGSRTGDIDPGVMIFMLRKLAEDSISASEAADQLEEIVNRQSGLKGVSQLSTDMRSLRDAIGKGDKNARLAVDQFTYIIRKFVGAYAAALGGLDMLVFTGGIGENDAATRAEVCTGLESLGVRIDDRLNQSAKGEAAISSTTSEVRVLVIPAAEDLTIVNHVSRLLL